MTTHLGFFLRLNRGHIKHSFKGRSHADCSAERCERRRVRLQRTSEHARVSARSVIGALSESTMSVQSIFHNVWTEVRKQQGPRKLIFVCNNSQTALRYPGRRPVRSWSQTCSELEFGLSGDEQAGLRHVCDTSATSLGLICDQIA